jgi:hypothetical protein
VDVSEADRGVLHCGFAQHASHTQVPPGAQEPCDHGNDAENRDRLPEALDYSPTPERH